MNGSLDVGTGVYEGVSEATGEWKNEPVECGQASERMGGGQVTIDSTCEPHSFSCA